MQIVAWVLVLCACALLGAIAVCAFWSGRLQASKRKIPVSIPLPAISVIKPLCGANEELLENLRSFYLVDYPAPIELIFVAETESDPAWKILAEAQTPAPDRTTKKVIAGSQQGWLPKTWSVRHGLAAATHEHVVFADADVRIDGKMLRDVVARSTFTDVGAAYAQPICAHAGGIGGVLDAVVTNYTAFVLQPLLERLGADHLAGTLYAMRRSVLVRVGGFESVWDNIAEDISLGKKIRAAGYRLSLAAYPVLTVSGKLSVCDFFTHQIRWLRTWRCTTGISAALISCFSSLAIAGLGVALQPGLWEFLPLLAAGEMMILAHQERCVHLRRLDLRVVVCGPLALLLEQLITMWSLVGRNVTWAKRRYLLSSNGTILRVCRDTVT